MRLKASALLGLALLLFGDKAWAQEPPPQTSANSPWTEDEKKAWSFFFFEEVLLRSCDDPTLRSAIALPQPKLILEATDDGKTTVKARAGLAYRKSLVASLEVASPRNSSGETTLASLDGLSNGSSAELSISWFRWEHGSLENALITIQELPEIKKLRSQKTGTGSDSADPAWSIEKYRKPPASRPSAVAMLGGHEAYREVLDAYREEHPTAIPVFTLRTKAEQKEFRFFTPSAGPPAGLRRTSESHTDYQFTASMGAYLWGRAYSAVNYRRGTRYEDGVTQEFCSPAGAARILDCMTLVVAPPQKGNPEALEFELRGLFGSIGLATHVTRDLQANVTIVDLPIYLLQKLGTSEMELNLGARVQWRSDTEDFALGVFIGPALSTVLRMGTSRSGV
jgi:hypothetical protein